jgi:hypothetical protein
MRDGGWLHAGLGLLLLCAMADGVTEAQTRPARRAPVQPIPFSHKLHMSQGLECVGCHESPTAEDTIALPPTATCMACHATVKAESPAIQKLAEYVTNKEEVPWRRVYSLPDFVWFTHKQHAAATCEDCHGPVREREVIAREQDLSMGACMDCHRTRSASVACDVCHAPL